MHVFWTDSLIVISHLSSTQGPLISNDHRSTDITQQLTVKINVIVYGGDICVWMFTSEVPIKINVLKTARYKEDENKNKSKKRKIRK